MRHFETYLGDAVYAYISESRDIVLYTSDGNTDQSNRIVLEPQVLDMFAEWLGRCTRKIEAGYPREARETASDPSES